MDGGTRKQKKHSIRSRTEISLGFHFFSGVWCVLRSEAAWHWNIHSSPERLAAYSCPAPVWRLTTLFLVFCRRRCIVVSYTISKLYCCLDSVGRVGVRSGRVHCSFSYFRHVHRPNRLMVMTADHFLLSQVVLRKDSRYVGARNCILVLPALYSLLCGFFSTPSVDYPFCSRYLRTVPVVGPVGTFIYNMPIYGWGINNKRHPIVADAVAIAAVKAWLAWSGTTTRGTDPLQCAYVAAYSVLASSWCGSLARYLKTSCSYSSRFCGSLASWTRGGW